MLNMIFYLFLINSLTFFMFKTDKNRARKAQYRIPEKTLLLFSFLGGSIGAWLAMILCRHKTRHLKFLIGIPAIFIFQCVSLYLIYHFL